MLRLSIVIPMYKAERFIGSCIDTIHRQGLDERDYEIIAIDDGSPDGTGDICDELADTLPNFRVIHQENAGAGAARNRGIDAAAGRYLYFFDVDDDLEDGCLLHLVERCERERLDVLLFGAEVRYENEECRKLYPQDPHYFERRQPSGVVTGEEMFIAQQRDWNFCGQPCMLMTRLSFVRDCGARFAEGIMNEDNFYVLRATLRAERADVDPGLYYKYIVRPNTVTTSNVSGDRIFLAHLKLSETFEHERLAALSAGKDELAYQLGQLLFWFMDVVIANVPEDMEHFPPFQSERFASLALPGRFSKFVSIERGHVGDEAARANAEAARADDERARADRESERASAAEARADAGDARIGELEVRLAEEAGRAERAEARVAELEDSTTWKVGRVVTALPRSVKAALSKRG